MAKIKGKNKRIEELKYGVLHMASALGTEQKIRKVFELFAKSVHNAWLLPEKEIRTLLYKMAFANGCAQEIQQAFSYFDKLPQNRPSEQETRMGIISTAVRMGVPKEDMLVIFNKYDNLLKICTSDAERKQISYMGAIEIHKLLGIRGPLIIDGIEVIPAMPGFNSEELNQNNFVKLD